MAQFSEFDLLREARRRGLFVDEENALLAEARQRGLEVSREEAAPPPRPQPAPTPMTPPTTIGGELIEVIKGIPSGAMGLLETAATGAAALLPSETEQAVRRRIGEIAQPAREALAPEPGYEQSVGRKAGEALGSTIPFFGLGPLGVAGRVGAAGLAAAAGAGEARQRAEQEGGMEDRGLATALGVIPGLMDILPPFRFAERILDRVPNKEKGLLLEYVKRAAATGGEEGLQEATQNITQNLIEKGVYNPDQDIFAGAGEEGAYGFGVGAFVQGLTDLALGRRMRGGVEPPGGEDGRARVGAEQTVEGADTGGIGLPVSRGGAERPDVEGLAPEGMDIPSRAVARAYEGEEPTQPALAEARFQMGEPAIERIQPLEPSETSAVTAFKPELIEQMRVPDYKSREKLIEMPIDDFLSLAKPGRIQAKEEDVTKLLEEGTKFSSIPFLNAYISENGELQVQGHEGRHRARALKAAGFETMPVIIRSDIRWSEQVDPKAPDYETNWPTKIVSETGTASVPMPITRAQSIEPYQFAPITAQPQTEFRKQIAPEDYVYHVTRTESVPSIEQKGLLPMQTSNWVTAKDKKRYGEGDVYAFSNKEDAKRWAAKMDWDFNQKLGSGNVSIVTVRRPEGREFEIDKNDPFSQAGSKGPWLKTKDAIPAENIVSAEIYSPTKAALRMGAPQEVEAPRLPVKEVQDTVSKLTQGWTNKPNIKVVESYKDLPKGYQTDQYKDARGLMFGNDIYVVASNAASPADVKSTVFHESLGHYGLRELFRDRLDATLQNIFDTNTAVQAAANSWLKQYPNLYQGTNRTLRAVEEVLATKAETGQIKEPGIRAAFNRLAAMVRKFLRGMGISLDYSNNDIANILREAAERVQKGQPARLEMPEASPRFQVSNYDKILGNVLEQNDKLPEWSQGLGNTVVDKMSKLPEWLRQAQYSAYSLPQTTELLENYVPRIRVIERLLGYRAAYTTGLMKVASENHANYVKTVRSSPELFKKFNNVFNDINLFQVPVRDQSVRDLLTRDRASLSDQNKKYYDIATEFYSLPVRFQNAILSADESTGAYADYRRMGDKKFDIFAKTYGGQLGMGVIRDLRERFERERLPMYAPLVRGEGAHWLYAETTDGRQLKESFPNAAARELSIKKRIEEGSITPQSVVRATRPAEIRQKGPPPVGFLGDVVNKLEASLASMPEPERRKVIDEVYETFLQYMPSNMLRQELTSRQTFEVDGAMQFGVLGFDTDALAVYDRTMPKMAYQLGNLKYALPLENAMRKINEQAKLYEIAVRENNLPTRLQGKSLMSVKSVFDGVADLRKRMDFAYNPSYASWVNAFATGNYVYSIAGNVSSALINTTVLPMMTFPSLVAKHGFIKSFRAMTQAAAMFAKGGVDDQGNFTFGNAATGEIKTFFDYLTKRGAIGIAAEQELRQAQRASVSGYQNVLDKINFVMGYVFKNSERFNREVTMLASFMLSREKGKGFRESAEEAIRLNNNINGTVLPETGSRLYQNNFGRIVLTFRTFALTQIINIARAYGRALNVVDATPEERAMARKQLLGVYGMTYMVSGIKGLPLFGAAEVLAAALMGDDDEPYDLQQEILESLGTLGLNGPLNALTKVDIASRTGFNGMFWRDDPKRLAELGYPLYIVERVAGPSYGLIQAQIRGYNKIAEGDVERGFESILPAPLRNPLKAARYAREGALTKDGLPIVKDVSAWNSTAQIFGFAPAELSSAQEQITATFEISDKLRKRRTALLTNLYTATSAGDPEATLEAYNAIDKFNIANPLYRINGKSLRASYRERQRRMVESVNGIYLPRDLRMTVDQYMADIG